jgi:hypothetical protein
VLHIAFFLNLRGAHDTVSIRLFKQPQIPGQQARIVLGIVDFVLHGRIHNRTFTEIRPGAQLFFFSHGGNHYHPDGHSFLLFHYLFFASAIFVQGAVLFIGAMLVRIQPAVLFYVHAF